MFIRSLFPNILLEILHGINLSNSLFHEELKKNLLVNNLQRVIVETRSIHSQRKFINHKIQNSYGTFWLEKLMKTTIFNPFASNVPFFYSLKT